MSKAQHHRRLDAVEETADATRQREDVRRYRCAVRAALEARLARLRGEDVEIPDVPDRPDCLPEPTGDAKRKLQERLDRYRTDPDDR